MARIRAYSLILLTLYALAVVVWIALSHGLSDANGKPLGTDFASFYAAGSLVLDGRAASVYDMAAHYAREQLLFGAHTPYYAWFYPPFFLLIATPLAAFPYLAALAIWQFVTFAGYFAVMRAILLTAPLTRSQTVLGLLATAAFPGGLHQPGPRSEWLPDGSAVGRGVDRTAAPVRFWPAYCSACWPTNRNLGW
ncbi:glycosyltransferase family 87 protein [Nitrobacter hamburgensis]|uniref:glycosyltransferase family 87 protein n=1 Tax=Nitrobacter hamburgensis TaxID=912 RepID=UPI00031F1AC5|nr:glycosyltransferase family 87 protein [Nitrobacter hamburgensis]